MMTTYRCTVCLTNWPPTSEFSPCPECGGAINQIGNDPIDVTEALSRKRHADFEKYYRPLRQATQRRA